MDDDQLTSAQPRRVDTVRVAELYQQLLVELGRGRASVHEHARGSRAGGPHRTFSVRLLGRFSDHYGLASRFLTLAGDPQ